MAELIMIIEGPEKELCEIWRSVFNNMYKWPKCGFLTQTIELKMTTEEFLKKAGDGYGERLQAQPLR